MLQLNDHVALQDLHATSEPVLVRILVPLVEHVQLLVSRMLEVLHAGGDFHGAGAARAVETVGFHLRTGHLARVEKEGTGGDLGGLAAGHESNCRHKLGKKKERSAQWRKLSIID